MIARKLEVLFAILAHTSCHTRAASRAGGGKIELIRPLTIYNVEIATLMHANERSCCTVCEAHCILGGSGGMPPQEIYEN